MKADFYFIADLSPMEGMFSDENIKAAQSALCEAVGNDSNLHVPYDTGYLHDSIEIGEDYVTWNADYAIYVYEGSHTISSGIAGHASYNKWLEFARQEYGEKWSEIVRSILIGE